MKPIYIILGMEAMQLHFYGHFTDYANAVNHCSRIKRPGLVLFIVYVTMYGGNS